MFPLGRLKFLCWAKHLPCVVEDSRLKNRLVAQDAVIAHCVVMFSNKNNTQCPLVVMSADTEHTGHLLPDGMFLVERLKMFRDKGQATMPSRPLLSSWPSKRDMTRHFLPPARRFSLGANASQGLCGDRGRTTIHSCPLVVTASKRNITGPSCPHQDLACWAQTHSYVFLVIGDEQCLFVETEHYEGHFWRRLLWFCRR